MNLSEWIRKNTEVDPNSEPTVHRVNFIEKNDEERLVYGIVYEPGVNDTDGEFADEVEIRKAAHLFLARYRSIKVEHLTTNEMIEVVESYSSPVEFTLGGQPVSKGAWVMVVKVFDEEVWELVKSGQLTGFSMGGFATRVFEDDDTGLPVSPAA
jgi:hypothetical protein